MHKSLQELEPHGIFAAVYIPTASSSPRKGMGDTPLTQKEREEFLALINAVGNNPSIFAYWQTDEPELNNIGPKRLQEIYELFRTHDPYRPVIIVNHGLTAIRDYQYAANICTPDPYLVFQEKGGSLRPTIRQGMHLDQVTTGEESFRAKWQTPQAYNSAFFGTKGARRPTAREMRTQQTNGMIHGVTGFTWYNQYMLWDEPGVLTSLPYLSQEYRVLFYFLVNAKLQKLEGNPAREAKAIIQRKKGPEAILVVNLLWEPQEITIQDKSLSAVPTWKIAGSTETIPGNQSEIVVSLQPFESTILFAPHVEFPENLNWQSVEKSEADILSNLVLPGNIAHQSNGTQADSFNFNRKSSALALMTIDGIKFPQGIGCRMTGFVPGAGIELTFPQEVSPKTLKLIGSNITEGHVEIKENEQWVTVAPIPAPNGNFERTISLPGKPTHHLRVVATNTNEKNVFTIQELEVYEEN